VCQFITCGRSGDYNFLVMELLGENLSELRRRQAGPAGIAAGNDGKFSLLTTLRLGTVFIKALQQIHEQGYIHRDVKPVRPPAPRSLAFELTDSDVVEFCSWTDASDA